MLSLEDSQLLQATCCDPSLESVMCSHTLRLVLLPFGSHEEPVFPHLIIAWAVCSSMVNDSGIGCVQVPSLADCACEALPAGHARPP